MGFDEFKKSILDYIHFGWEEDIQVTIEEIYKNNGEKRTAILIRKEGAVASPTLYLENYYEMLGEGFSVDEILLRIRYDYERTAPALPTAFTFPQSFPEARDNVIFFLINYEKNRMILSDCPHIRVFDLAITFRWVFTDTRSGVSTTLIHNREAETWGVGAKELMQAAMINTPDHFPPELKGLHQMICGLARSSGDSDWNCENDQKGEFNPDEEEDRIYVITNSRGIYGASVMFYDGFLLSVYEALGMDYYILPSSIHEMLLVPVDVVDDPTSLLEMVRDVNDNIVKPEEILSYSVYYYNGRDCRISMLPKKHAGTLR